MLFSRSDVGRLGEDIALQFFLERGFSVVDRNWRCRRGEIDLVLQKEEKLHFVEVKARFSPVQHSLEAISSKKRIHLERAVDAWLEAHPVYKGFSYQVDGFCLWSEEAGRREQVWIEGI